MATVRIPLSGRKYPGLFALVDEEDAERVLAYKWHLDLKGSSQRYAYANIRLPDGRRTTVRLHRLLMPEAACVDHIDGDGLNCCRLNLREATASLNVANQKKQRRHDAPFKGIYLDKRRGTWTAWITVAGKGHYLGSFRDPEEAARAYDAAARKHFGAFACVNFPWDGERGAT